MDAWQRTFDQLRALLRGLSAAQRASLLVVSLGVLAGMGWLIWSSTGPTDEFLLGGKSFSPTELTQTQSALKAAGLTQFKVVGQRISVPAREADRYTAAAIARQTLPAQFAAEFDRMQAKVNVFTSGEQRRELLEEARKSRLAQILRSIPEIEEAVVEWDRPRQVNLFRPAPQVAAHVSVKPRDGRELSPELVHSLKLFVAGALAGAEPDDVTVVDMNTSRVYGRRSPEDAASDRVHELAKQHETEYSSQITRALGHIPDVLVSVTVELAPEDVDSETHGSFVNPKIVPVSHRRQPREDRRQARSNHPPEHLIDAAPVNRVQHRFDLVRTAAVDRDADPGGFDSESDSRTGFRKSVQVAVSIPESYYAAIARARGASPGQSLVHDTAYRSALAGIKAETQRDVREKLARLLPPGNDPPAISVTTYTPLKASAQLSHSPAETPIAPKISLDFSDWKLPTGIAICGSSLLLSLLLMWRVRRRAWRSTSSPTQASVDGPGQVQPLDSDTASMGQYSDVGANSSSVLAELAELERRTPAFATPATKRQTAFDFLNELSIDDIADLLETEHPQTIALVATALPPTQAAEILHALPESLRWDVSQRLTRIGPVTLDVLGEVAASLRSRLRLQPPSKSELTRESAKQLQPAVISSQAVQTASPTTDTAPSDVTTWPFTFDDLPALDVRSIATLLESIDLRAYAVALLDRSEAFKQSLFNRMPKHVAAAVKQHSRQLGPVRLIDIAASQQAIAGVAWNLSVHGMIALPAHLEHAA